MKYCLSISLFLLLHLSVLAQTDTTIFNALHNVETAEYILSVPSAWHFEASQDASSKDRRFDFTGVALPAEVNHTPVVATFNLRKHAFADVKEATDFVLSEITTVPDRITPPGYNYVRDTITIATGETAYVFSTHYFRRSKACNFTRIDMVVYSAKRKAAYMLTATFQYRDSTYEIEKNYTFKQYVYRVFKTLVLR